MISWLRNFSIRRTSSTGTGRRAERSDTLGLSLMADSEYGIATVLTVLRFCVTQRLFDEEQRREVATLLD